jgi:ABC-type branched-subunit amino acid transport system substrate-binding protein
MTRKVAICGVAVVLIGGAAMAARAWQPTKASSFANVLKIGVVVADPPATYGAVSRAVRDGLTLAQADLNAEWKDSPHVELVFRDSGGSATGANERLRELKKEGVSLVADVVGPEVLSGCVGTIRQEKILVLSGSNKDPSIANAFGPYFFRTAPTEAGVGGEVARWGHQLGVQVPLVIYTEGDRGEQLKSGFTRSWGVFTRPQLVAVAPGQVKAQGIVDRLSTLGPSDAIVLFTQASDTSEFLRELRSNQPKVPIIAPQSSLDVPELKGSVPELLPLVLMLATEAGATPNRRAAIETAWRKDLGRAPGAPTDVSPEVFAAYDTLQVLARAARETHGDVEATLPRLRVMDYDGCTGRIQFDTDRERCAPPAQRRALTDQGASIPWTPAEPRPSSERK